MQVFFFYIPFTIKRFKRPMCVAMRSVRFYRCVRCTIIWGAFVLGYRYVYIHLFIREVTSLSTHDTVMYIRGYGDIGCKMRLISRNIGR